MGYTVFYEEVKKDNPKIGWKDILSESFKRHSMKDLEYALAAGSAFDTASPETMLKKWHKPWVWTRIFLLLSVVGFGFYGLLHLFGMNPNVGWPMLIILSCIAPITSMVLCWELNVARDVSFFKLLGCFFLGGLLSIAFTLMLGETNIDQAALELTNTTTNVFWNLWVAPITEEPGKLLAGLLILIALSKAGCNIFGCTGIAIGAGVGTGFTVFETFGYVLTYATKEIVSEDTLPIFFKILSISENPFDYGEIWKAIFDEGLSIVKARSIPGINGHMLMCIPYIAMIALVYHETKDWKKSILNPKTGGVFFASCVLHGWWDCMSGVAIKVLGINENLQFTSQQEHDVVMKQINDAVTCQEIIITVLYLLCNLYVIRLCLQQAVRDGNYTSGQGLALGERTNSSFSRQGEGASAAAIKITSIGTVLPGAVWPCTDTVLIGKMENCSIRFPADTKGLSRVHCQIKKCNGYWSVLDMGSSYGTLLNGVQLMPNTEYKLLAGSVLQLGSQLVQLRIV